MGVNVFLMLTEAPTTTTTTGFEGVDFSAACPPMGATSPMRGPSPIPGDHYS